MDVSSSLSAPSASDNHFSVGYSDVPAPAGERAGQDSDRFRQLADAMPQMVWIARPDGYREYFNQRWYDYTGATAAQSRGGGWIYLFHPDDHADIRRRWQHSFATAAPFEIHARLRRASDGAYRWHLARALPQRDASGQVRQWYGSYTDVHESRLAERLLAQQLSFSRSLADSVAHGLFAVDCDGLAIFINPAAERILGWNADELIGRKIHQIIHFQHADRSCHPPQECPLLNVVRTGRMVRADDDVFTTRSGALLPVSYSSAPAYEDGKAIGAVVSFQDISERKQQEQTFSDQQQALKRYSEELEQRVDDRTAELRESNARLQSSNRELQDFAFVASHDLQEPLRKIQAFGERLANHCEPALDPQAQDYLRRMKNAAERMQTLISDLLAFSCVTTQGRPFVRVDLRQIAAEVVSDLESAVERSGGSVELGELPSIDADPVQMRQLLQNLIGNGLKFRRPGVAPRVRIRGELILPQSNIAPGAGQCQLVVEDNGIGFDEKYLDRIFDVFQRLHGRSAYDGTGIGLAVCRKIAERHGGSITARSQPGEGSAFIVTLAARQNNSAMLQGVEESDGLT